MSETPIAKNYLIYMVDHLGRSHERRFTSDEVGYWYEGQELEQQAEPNVDELLDRLTEAVFSEPEETEQTATP